MTEHDSVIYECVPTGSIDTDPWQVIVLRDYGASGSFPIFVGTPMEALILLTEITQDKRRTPHDPDKARGMEFAYQY